MSTTGAIRKIAVAIENGREDLLRKCGALLATRLIRHHEGQHGLFTGGHGVELSMLLATGMQSFEARRQKWVACTVRNVGCLYSARTYWYSLACSCPLGRGGLGAARGKPPRWLLTRTSPRATQARLDVTLHLGRRGHWGLLGGRSSPRERGWPFIKRHGA